MVWLFVETTSHREERGQSRLHPQGAIERGRDCLAIFILNFEQHVQNVVEFGEKYFLRCVHVINTKDVVNRSHILHFEFGIERRHFLSGNQVLSSNYQVIYIHKDELATMSCLTHRRSSHTCTCEILRPLCATLSPFA